MNEQQYYELQDLTLEATDRLSSGEGRSGTHYELMYLLGRLGIFVNSREEACKVGQRLCDEYIQAELEGAK
jgi:hypothetical protein